MPVESTTQSLCDLALRFGEDSEGSMVGGSQGSSIDVSCAVALPLHIAAGNMCLQSRPFGVALLIAGWDNLGPVLYHTDPSGTYTRYSAKAIGSGAEGAQTSLQEGWRKDLTLAEAEVLALSTLKQVMEEKVRRSVCASAKCRACSCSPSNCRLIILGDSTPSKGCFPHINAGEPTVFYVFAVVLLHR
jgi:20S proteasome subunit alpha 5